MAKQHLRPPFDEKVKLKEYDPAYTGNFESEEETLPEVEKMLEQVADLQEKLYAESKQSLLIVAQAMDTGGKDGLIKNIFRGINPSGVRITSFKAPTPEELKHDFLWRIHKETPAHGMIGVFNRSHYEDVLVVRVHELASKPLIKQRYEHINHFEEMLAAHGTKILKFYLHISKDEQKKRLQARLDDPQKHWKFNPGDVDERGYWDDYMDAYEHALNKCHHEYAPWYVVPANNKWYRNYVVTKAILEALQEMKPEYPVSPPEIAATVISD